MKTTLRLLASVKPGRYLEAGNPTGLTGLLTHPSPRATLLYLYSKTLDKLKTFPEHSVYRQSAEAVTKHRMNIIESIKPPGFEEWSKNAAELVKKNPKAFQSGGTHQYAEAGDHDFIITEEKDDEYQEFATLEGSRSLDEKLRDLTLRVQQRPDESKNLGWEPEPRLEASQIRDVETQIGGGLIEEVIQVAEGELKLVDTLAEAKVWEELEEKPEPGQWDYFARDQHTRGTQEPPNK